MKSSFIRELLKVTDQPDVISFGGGFPAAELFPIEQMQAACDKVLTEKGRKALQYTTTEAITLCVSGLRTMQKPAASTSRSNNIMITTGSAASPLTLSSHFHQPR
jgi:2-aminoadipate transaminase